VKEQSVREVPVPSGLPLSARSGQVGAHSVHNLGDEVTLGPSHHPYHGRVQHDDVGHGEVTVAQRGKQGKGLHGRDRAVATAQVPGYHRQQDLVVEVLSWGGDRFLQARRDSPHKPGRG